MLNNITSESQNQNKGILDELNLGIWKLQKLAKVNYLTGENGSGKSIILRKIFEFKSDSYWLTDCISKPLNNNRIYDLGDKNMIYLKQNDYENLIKIVPEVEELFYARPGLERGAMDKIIQMCKIIYFKYLEGFQIFILEEPEIHLHPKLQKMIPVILQKFTNHLDIQFFIETHSPFMISASGSLDFAKEMACRNQNGKYNCLQKTYFVHKGKIVNRKLEPTLSATYGYWGSKVKRSAARMLGAGLGDFIKPLDVELTPDRPTLVFCEGQGKSSDNKIYNIIFKDHNPPALFVSGRGSSQLESSFDIIQDIEFGLSANFRMIMLRDRDHQFKDLSDIQEFERVNKGKKVLRLRAIEMYLYHPEIIAEVLHYYDQSVNSELWSKLESLHQKIIIETNLGQVGDSYKYRLTELVDLILASVKIPNNFFVSIPLSLARFVTPSTKVYKELENIVFS